MLFMPTMTSGEYRFWVCLFGEERRQEGRSVRGEKDDSVTFSFQGCHIIIGIGQIRGGQRMVDDA